MPYELDIKKIHTGEYMERIVDCLSMDFYIIHGLILCLWQTLKKGQNLFGILVSSLQPNTFIIVFIRYL